MASRRPIGAWLLAAFFSVAPAACLFNADVPDGPCKGDEAVCDDQNPCTIDVCEGSGYCKNTASNDLVPDDGNPCTDDVCVDGVAQNTTRPDGATCGLNDQLQCVGGKCKCTTAEECGVDTECRTFACDPAEGCQSTNLDKDTPVDGADAADCKKRVCDGAGKVITVPDDTDPGPDPTPGDCKTNACDNGEVASVPNMMDFPADTTAGDCQTPACDASGKVISADAPDDQPTDDGNPCTMEGCNGGMLIDHVAVPDGTSCGAAASCGPTGLGYAQTTAETCQSGMCATAVTTSCGLYGCNGDVCLLTCMNNGQCIGGAYCNGGLCKPQNGSGGNCMADGDCVSQHCVDGVCCNTACNGLCEQCDSPGAVGVCVNIASGTDPDNECSDPQVCNGAGACKTPVGETCGADADCTTGQCEDGYCCNSDCAGDCRTCNQTGSIGTCKDVPAMQTSGACSNGSVCNGTGSCKKVDGQPCGGGNECLSGFCPMENGTDVCCNTACTNNCKSCIGSRTGGADGVCGDVLSATDPNNDCNGTCNMANGKGCCDGSGGCVPP